MLIYKHTTVDGCTRILESNTIRVTQPSALNDALECRPALRGIADEQGLRALAPSKGVVDHMVEEEIGNVLSQIPPELRAQLPPHVDDEFLRILVRRSGVAETAQRITLAVAEALGPFVGPLLHDGVNDNVGVMSFTARVDSASMWDRYSDGNRGVAIVLDDAHVFFHPRPEQPDNPMNLKRVTYVPARTPKHMVDLDVDELFFLKTKDWEYEQEVRMVRLLRDAWSMGAKDQAGHEVFVVDLPTEVVRGIVYGLRTSAEDRQSMDSILKRRSYAHVERFEMQMVDAGARLEVSPVTE